MKLGYLLMLQRILKTGMELTSSAMMCVQFLSLQKRSIRKLLAFVV